MKTGTLVSSLAQSIPYKTQQLKQERVRISYLDILMVWWDVRGHQGQKQSSNPFRKRKAPEGAI